MFRRSLLTLLICSGISLPSFGLTAGQEYIVLDKPLPNKTGTLVKVWSYACPFCYKFDVGVDPKVLPKIEAQTGLKFVPMHLESKGDYGKQATSILSGLAVIDASKGLTPESPDSLYKKAKDAWYTEYHKNGERWKGGEADFYATASKATGMSIEALKEAANNPKAKALVEDWRNGYDVAKIQGIPAYVVNGKYLIVTKAIRNFDGFVDMVNELSKKP